ncbi:UNVERIFIED_ORG: hypothetical protein LHK14_01875 [Roseateles sp. XES5]|nr:hypothetical protein [Roseateles sp. XES5]
MTNICDRETATKTEWWEPVFNKTALATVIVGAALSAPVSTLSETLATSAFEAAVKRKEPHVAFALAIEAEVAKGYASIIAREDNRFAGMRQKTADAKAWQEELLRREKARQEAERLQRMAEMKATKEQTSPTYSWRF